MLGAHGQAHGLGRLRVKYFQHGAHLLAVDQFGRTPTGAGLPLGRAYVEMTGYR